MNHIIKEKYLIEPVSMDAVGFFHYLVRKGSRLSLISRGQLENLQYQIVELLSEQFNRRTSGRSSSVPLETGQQIQQSVFYTIGYYLKSMPGAESALKALKKTALKEIFFHGKKLMEEDFEATKDLLHVIQTSRLATDLIAYNDTLDEGLPIFFRSYDMDYEAHETPASIDYPLSNDGMNLTGLDYINDYLKKLQLENEFCNCFPNEEIHSLLRGYDRQYKELLINVCDLVLPNAAGSLLLGRNGLSLTLSRLDLRYLQQAYASMSDDAAGESAVSAVMQLCRSLSLSDSAADYLKKSAAKLQTRFTNALKTHSLHHLFQLLDEENADEPVFHFEEKENFDCSSFRKLADEIRECRFISDKIIILKGVSLSMTDLAGLLEGSCFFDNEFQEVFEILEDFRLALLVKNMPFEPGGTVALEDECSHEWQIYLSRYLDSMEPARKSAILALTERIETDSHKL